MSLGRWIAQFFNHSHRVRLAALVTIAIVAGSGLVIYTTIEPSGVLQETEDSHLVGSNGQPADAFRAGDTALVVRTVCASARVEGRVDRILTDGRVITLQSVLKETFEPGCHTSRIALELPSDLHVGEWKYAAQIEFPYTLLRWSVSYRFRELPLLIVATPTGESIQELRKQVAELTKLYGKHRDADRGEFNAIDTNVKTNGVKLQALTEDIRRALAELAALRAALERREVAPGKGR